MGLFCNRRFNIYDMIKIKRSRDFKNVYKYGKSVSNQYIVMYFLENGTDVNRVGFSISKKVGKSVVRNRYKRLLYENFRLLDGDLKKGYDIIFIARNKIVESDFYTLGNAMRRLLKKSSLYMVNDK
ncbi:Ribonuclease P protein component [Thermoanaerobacterium aotearoense SCUT27]|uniref:Ribonuclease P protein component n=3 Tax=Thermoanaerobacterium TaxID=28895 RepID=W9EEN2_9THEO|nr:Ribonuclease P protein component [Thermoanaerobacterium saccharolyticum JW/SL-YS485]ETO39706.1 Ribonuclease P protein component [Thermoanaerobacterium aotearoense SCUT27]